MPWRRFVPELDDDDWLTARRTEGRSVRRIAGTVGVDPGRVRNALREAGLAPRIHLVRRSVPELTDVEWLTDRRGDGWSVRRIASHLHASGACSCRGSRPRDRLDAARLGTRSSSSAGTPAEQQDPGTERRFRARHGRRFDVARPSFCAARLAVGHPIECSPLRSTRRALALQGVA
jgi:hypothetical protein